MIKLDNMTLYYKPECPYCRKVLDFIDKNGIELNLRTANNPDEHRKLMEIEGGKTQVPCLVVDGKPMLESDDIIAFLKSKIS